MSTRVALIKDTFRDRPLNIMDIHLDNDINLNGDTYTNMHLSFKSRLNSCVVYHHDLVYRNPLFLDILLQLYTYLYSGLNNFMV